MRETIQNANGKQFHAVSLSGGKDSTAMLLLMIERDMPIDIVLSADTGMEFPEMYEHLEERQLMSLYNTGTRTGLIAALEEMRGYLAADETELRELTDSAIAKLRRMSDAEYDALDLFPDFEKEDMDAE